MTLDTIGQALRAFWRPPRTLRDPMLAAELFGTPTTLTTTTTESGGVVVTEASALKFPAVWAAVQCIAGDVASLPFFHYRRLPNGGKERYTTSRLYRVLHDEFNPEMTAMVGRETMTAHVLLWGNAYAEIVRNDLGQVVACYPIEPNRVAPERTEAGAIVYRVATTDGTEVTIPATRMLHLVGLGWNGLMGYSVIGLMRQSLGSGLAAEKLGSDVLNRGAKYSGFFEHPRTLGATARKNIMESIATDLAGTYRILEEGMTYKPGSMPLSDAQFMEQRKFSVTEVARIFGIPPHKLGDLERATFSNVEEENISYVMNTLRRWLVRWEAECNRKLIPSLEKGLQHTEHLIDGLLRGNIQSRYGAYSQGINNGFLSPNDIRQFENLNPIPDGDTYLVQGAMVPLDRLHDLVDARVKPSPPPPPPAPDPDDDEDDDEDEDTEEARTAMRHMATLLENLRAELIRRDEALEAAVPAAVLAALPPAPAPAPPTVIVDPTVFEAVEAGVSATIVAATTPILAAVTQAAATAATDADLRAWREATFTGLAGKLARRELMVLKKREADPTAAVAKLEAFYRRFIGDGLAELRPWVRRLPDPESKEAAVLRTLTGWAEDAMATCVAAVQQGGLGDVIRRWEIERAPGLTRVLLEAIDG